MKTVLVLSVLALTFTSSAFAADVGSDDGDIAAVYIAVPSAKTITKTSGGFRVFTVAGKTVFVDKTSSGYRMSGEKNSTFIDKSSSGYRVSNGGNATFINKSASDYRITGRSNTTYISRTSDGYRVSNGKTTDVISKTSDGYRVNSGR